MVPISLRRAPLATCERSDYWDASGVLFAEFGQLTHPGVSEQEMLAPGIGPFIMVKVPPDDDDDDDDDDDFED